MRLTRPRPAVFVFALLAGCACGGGHLMPTAEILRTAGSPAVVDGQTAPQHPPDGTSSSSPTARWTTTRSRTSPKAQAYLQKAGNIDIITFGCGRTAIFGQSCITGSPRVSSDLIALIRCRKEIGEPKRQLIQTGPVTWALPREGEQGG